MMLAGLAGLALLLVGCQANVPSLLQSAKFEPGPGPELSVTVRADVVASRQVQAVAAPVYEGKDVDHIAIALYRCEMVEDEVATEVEVASREVSNVAEGWDFVAGEQDFTFKNLHADTHYRIRGFAYSDTASTPANLISKTDLSSAVDFETTNDERPAPVGLRIRLADRAFDGKGVVQGVQVQDGGKLAYGFVKNFAGHIPVDPSPDLPTPGTPIPTPSVPLLEDYMNAPAAIAIEPSDQGNGAIWFADTGNHIIRRIFNQGNGVYTPMIREAGQDGVSGFDAGEVDWYLAKFDSPQGLAFGPDGQLFIADTNNNCIRVLDDNTGKITVLTGQGPHPVTGIGDVDGDKTMARFNHPTQITYDPKSDLVFVADTGNNKLRWVDPLTGETGTVPGLSSSYQPGGVAVIGDRLFFTESHCVRMVQVRRNGSSVTFANEQRIAGQYQGQAVGDGTVAQFNQPSGLAVDANRNLYVADSGNDRIQLVRFGAGGTVNVSTFVGGTPGRLNGTGTAAHFLNPRGLAVDPLDGTVYVADTNNHRLRLVD